MRFSLRFPPVESTVFLLWPESDSVATKGSIFDWFWIKTEAKLEVEANSNLPN